MTITVYATTTNTGQDVTRWLDEQQLAYTLKFIDEDKAAMKAFTKLSEGKPTLPLTVIEYDNGGQAKCGGTDLNILNALLYTA